MDRFCSRGDRADHFLLRHLAVQAAEGAFHQPEVADFLAEFHIAICDYHIAICNFRSRWQAAMSFKRLSK